MDKKSSKKIATVTENELNLGRLKKFYIHQQMHLFISFRKQ